MVRLGRRVVVGDVVDENELLDFWLSVSGGEFPLASTGVAVVMVATASAAATALMQSELG